MFKLFAFFFALAVFPAVLRVHVFGSDLRPNRTVIRLVIETSPGPIPEELRFNERLIVEPGQAHLTRTARTDSQVNRGSWSIDVPVSQVAAFFKRISEFDCSRFVRIEPIDPPDGGKTRIITLTYSDETTCVFLLDPGTTYQNSQTILDLIHSFTTQLQFPPQARSSIDV